MSPASPWSIQGCDPKARQMQRSWAIFNGHLPGISFLPIVSTMSGLAKCLNRNRGRERRAKWRLRSYLAGVKSGSEFRCGTLSTPDPFFHFLCAFLPSGLSLDLTDSIIPSQGWILGSGAPRVAVSGPAVHLVATVHLLICTSLWAVCCVRAGLGWPTPPTRSPAPGTWRRTGSRPARALCVWAACSEHASGPSGQGACSLGGWPQAVPGLLSSPLLLG